MKFKTETLCGLRPPTCNMLDPHGSFVFATHSVENQSVMPGSCCCSLNLERKRNVKKEGRRKEKEFELTNYASLGMHSTKQQKPQKNENFPPTLPSWPFFFCFELGTHRALPRRRLKRALGREREESDNKANIPNGRSRRESPATSPIKLGPQVPDGQITCFAFYFWS